MDDLMIKINMESLSKILKSHIGLHYGKSIDADLLEVICNNVIESIEYFFNTDNIKIKAD